MRIWRKWQNVGCLGCSIEVMSIVSRLNETIPTDDSMKPAPSHTEALRHLEQRLRSLHHFMTPQGPTFSTTSNQSSILDTAELYRTAALIFLEIACWRRLRCAPEVEHLVEAGLTILQRLKVCAVVWPLFIISCEAETNEEGKIVLATFKASKKSRKAGYIPWAQRLTEAAWKQDDLFTFAQLLTAAVPLLRYGSIISASSQLHDSPVSGSRSFSEPLLVSKL